MEKRPKISVIVPIYGVESFLVECIESIINQTFKDLEILLINDDSPDNCKNIIEEYEKKDSRIKVINKENGGYGQTCNLGLSIAQGEYISIIEPDDYIAPCMYEDLYNIAKKHDSEIVKSPFYDFLQTKEETSIKKVSLDKYKFPEDTCFTLQEHPEFLAIHPSIWSCIYKKEFLDKHNIRFVEAPGAGWTDNPFQVQTFCLAERICYTNTPYYYWRRLNKKSSDALKDYSIPFKRSEEIHSWLEKNNITNPRILSNLYFRELSYIGIVLDMKKISDKKDCYEKIKNLILGMDENLIPKSKRKFFKTAKLCPELLRLNIVLKNIRKNIISIRIRNKNAKIVLFGHNFSIGHQKDFAVS